MGVKVGENGAVQYLVKWKGWEEKHNTWEPAQSLRHIKKDIANFYEERMKTDVSVAAVVRKSIEKPIKLEASHSDERSEEKKVPQIEKQEVIPVAVQVKKKKLGRPFKVKKEKDMVEDVHKSENEKVGVLFMSLR